MEMEIESAVKIFEEVEKLRRGCDAKLKHLQNNRRCEDCGKDWMPKKYEPCPECGSKNTRLLKARRKCGDCGYVWQPSDIGVCPGCGSASSVANPKDDSYIRQIALPRLRVEEEFYEDRLREMIGDHPVWEWAQQIKGAGLTSVGRIIGRTDIRRLKTVSEMWAHCGWGLYRDGTRQRKRKGEMIDYDPQLQSSCVVLAESLIRQKGSYYDYYLRQKEINASLTPAWRHNKAFRHMIKLFLSHLWEAWRKAEGLDAPEPYAFAILKHPEGHLITASDMVRQPVEVSGPAKVTRKRRVPVK